MAKIIRVTQQPYGDLGNVGEFGQFGSLFNGSPNTTKDPATIQSLSNFRYGLIQEVIGNRRPAMEDFNGLLLLIFHQVGYILQQGTPEWDSGTTYYEHSFVQVDGKTYVSLQDTNLNKNPETEPTWWGFPDGSVPTGMQSPYGGSIAPAGYLLCNGVAVSRITYARLFAITGTAYGIGDGSTTFNVPNKTGKGSIGKDSGITDFNAVGKSGGEKDHTLTISEMPAHDHTQDNFEGGSTTGNGGFSNINLGGKNTGSKGGSSSHNNMHPYEIDNWIIKT